MSERKYEQVQDVAKESKRKKGTRDKSNDPFIYIVLQCIAVIFAFAIIAPSIFGVYVYYNTNHFRNIDPRSESFVVRSLSGLPKIAGAGKDITGVIINAIPAVLMIVCYRKDRPSRLNIIGQILTVIFLVGFCVSMVGIAIFSASDEKMIRDIPGTEKTYNMLLQGCEQSARSALLYLTMFLGMRRRKDAS